MPSIDGLNLPNVRDTLGHLWVAHDDRGFRVVVLAARIEIGARGIVALVQQRRPEVVGAHLHPALVLADRRGREFATQVVFRRIEIQLVVLRTLVVREMAAHVVHSWSPTNPCQGPSWGNMVKLPLSLARPSGAAAKLAEQEGVDIRKYSVIYDAIEEVKAAMEGMLAPTLKEQVTATIEVREVFNITKVGLVAGAMVKTGKVKRSDKARLIRDGIVIFTGNINALKRFKDDVKEVGTNFECGISLTNCNDIKIGDIIESYEEVEVKQTL